MALGTNQAFGGGAMPPSDNDIQMLAIKYRETRSQDDLERYVTASKAREQYLATFWMSDESDDDESDDDE